MTFKNSTALTTVGAPVLLPPASTTKPAKSVRAIAKEDGVDLNALLDILKRQRPAGSKMEQEFCDQFLLSIEGMNEDEYGNFWLQVGDVTTTMFSCHTDTVASKDGFQNLEWQEDILWLHNGKPGQCLGADDGAGIWLMLEMIKAGKPGLYVFHREEEIGGLGSADIVAKRPQLVAGIQRAIAFDRMDLDSVITHQRSKRCCSATFADALATELNKTEGFNYKKDPTGSFTDTANYDGIIAECTNLSVGYYKQHGPKEHLDVAHLYQLREAMLRIDFEALPTERDSTVDEYDDDWRTYGGYGSYAGYGGNYAWSKPKGPKTNVEKIEELIRGRVYTLAKIYDQKGWTCAEVEEMIEDYWKSVNWENRPDNKVETKTSNANDGEWQSFLDCYACEESLMLEHWGDASDGDPCLDCGSTNTTVQEYRREDVGLDDDDEDYAGRA